MVLLFQRRPMAACPRGLVRLIVCFALCVVVGTARAQYDPAFSHYWQLETQFNPAAVGRSPQLTINAAYMMGAGGFDDAGGTMYAGANMAFAIGKTRHGVGALFQNDEIGLFSHKRFAVQYAYHQPLFGGVLSIGVEADMLSETIDGSGGPLLLARAALCRRVGAPPDSPYRPDRRNERTEHRPALQFYGGIQYKDA